MLGSPCFRKPPYGVHSVLLRVSWISILEGLGGFWAVFGALSRAGESRLRGERG